MSSIINPNFSEMVNPLKPGLHLCVIRSFEAKMSKAGNPYIQWKLETIGTGHVVFYSTPISGKGAGMFKHLVHSSGDVSYQNGPYDLNSVLGKNLMCEVAPETYLNNFGQERTIMKVKSVSSYNLMQATEGNEEDLPF